LKKILIIGGAGFIGHHLSLAFKELNYDIKIVDSLSVNNFLSIDNNNVKDYPHPKLSKLITIERFKLFKEKEIIIDQLDSRDYENINKLIANYNPNVIIHLAAVSHANKSNVDPFNSFDHSLRTLENVLDSSKNLKDLERFIYFSSSMVYGNFKADFVDEDSKCDPMGIYGTLKYCCEKIIKAYSDVFGVQYTIIRPSALYGERCISRRVGQIFIENALNRKDIIINADDNEKLDFTYINDLIHGIIQVIKNKNSINQVFNITFGEGRKISTLVEILSEYFTNLKIKKKERDKLMPKRGKLLCDKAKNFINYLPSWNLEKGYSNYIKWYIDFFEKNKKNLK
jgi:nucleoside-diphosphate-sugar epimerase